MDVYIWNNGFIYVVLDKHPITKLYQLKGQFLSSNKCEISNRVGISGTATITDQGIQIFIKNDLEIKNIRLQADNRTGKFTDCILRSIKTENIPDLTSEIVD
ncbi:hypothetical protein [Phage DSL-LC06]|nr:hypothetical protein [Phage DSL-LC06]